MPGLPPTLKKIIITDEAGLTGLANAWRALEQKVCHILPFQTYDWNLCWWKIFNDNSLLHRNLPAIAAIFNGDELVAVMPLTNSHIGFQRIFLYRYVRPFGADPNLTELRVPLTLPGYEQVILGMWEQLTQHEMFGLTEFQIIHQTHQAEQFLRNNHALCPLTERSIPNYVLHLNGDWPSFKSQLKRNIKESLRRCYNSLKRDSLQMEFIAFQGREQVQKHLPAFYALHRHRAAAANTVEHPDYFSHPRHQAFLSLLLDSPFASRMYLFCLKLNQNIVALRLGFRMNDELYLYYSGYDLAYARYSVMTTVVAETIQWAFQQDIRRINLSVGEDISKTRWNPEVIRYTEYQCVRNSWWRRYAGEQIFHLRQLKKNLRPQLRPVEQSPVK
ncbi:GNAT family N-acetyltransferase [Undibacterium griseum]|uniref:GNAT family N-acetyltransferase n=1 Tax=Undibacterium griseum TaxID=2762295 RepID=A0ABR6YK22_9BURK|nr:GNAT family N-acetyltransferase [Undibacterium griseum]MBC3884140.1 GNAT family N-acetyltransferase [Undibacterium griseum]